MLGFDDYPDIAARLRSIVAGEKQHPHTPAGPAPAAADLARRREAGRRRRPTTSATRRPAVRARRLDRRPDGAAQAGRPAATGAAPSARSRRFRGSFVSRRPTDVLDEARWLAADGVRELFLVSENSTSYGKDLGDLRLLETLLPELAAVDGVERVRVSYLQPAEIRPGLLEAIATTPGVASYFDLSFQHASNTVLRRMRRFGDPESFLGLLDQVRVARTRGRRPLQRHRRLPRRDRAGPRDALRLPGRRPARRGRGVRLLRRGRHRGRDATTTSSTTTRSAPATARVADLVEELTSQRAEERIGEDGRRPGRGRQPTARSSAARTHQGPEVDGTTTPGRLPTPGSATSCRAVVVEE